MASYHTRSNSLPSASHPVTAQFDEKLCRLSSSQAASVSDRLTGLTDLYVCVDELLQLPSNQQSLSQIQSMLDGSVRFLDICSTSRDVLQQLKEKLQDIQSVLRRRCSGELNITSEASEYLKARKTVKKAVKICLKQITSNTIQGDVEQITVEIFASLLSYINGSKSQSSKTWSVVSKLMNKTSEASVAPTSNFDGVDSTLASLVCQKKSSINIEKIMNQTMTLESEIQDLDEVLECLFRHLVKTRATLLNILIPYILLQYFLLYDYAFYSSENQTIGISLIPLNRQVMNISSTEHKHKQKLLSGINHEVLNIVLLDMGRYSSFDEFLNNRAEVNNCRRPFSSCIGHGHPF